MDVAAVTRDCVGQLIAVANLGETNQRQKAWADDQCARLKLWADSLGVFAQERHYTFQHRLRLNPQLLQVTLQLLKGLLANIRLLKGSLIQSEPDADIASKGDDDESDSSSSIREDLQTRIDVRLREVRDRISRLVRLSVLLRQEGAQKREAKALIFEPLDAGGAPLASDFNSYVDKVLIRMFDFAQADASTNSTTLPEFMRKRLKSVIEARWRRLSLGNHHAKALAGKNAGLATDLEMPQLRSMVSSKSDGETPQPSQAPTMLATKTVARVHSHIPASAASTAPRDLTYDGKALGKALSTGTATTKIRPNKVNLPPPPSLKGDAEEFECPYCHIMCSRKEQEKSLWQVHVMHDLAPYICLFEDCATPTSMFRTAGAWIGHMTEAHSKTIWNCAERSQTISTESGEGCQRVFLTIEDYKAHISAMHPSSISEDHLALLLQMDGRQQLRIDHCLFCGFAKTQSPKGAVADDQDDLETLTKHIAEEHLHSLALLSLPWDTPDGDDLHSARASMSSDESVQELLRDEKMASASPQTTLSVEGNVRAASFDEIRRNFPAEPKAALKSCQHKYCTDQGSHCRVPDIEHWRVDPEIGIAISIAAHTDQATAEARWPSAVPPGALPESTVHSDTWSPVDRAQHLELSIDKNFDMEILESGDQDKTWEDEQLSLLRAAATGDSRTLTELVKLGVDLTCTDSEGMNAVQLAVKNDHINCLLVLLDSDNHRDFEPKEQPLLCLAASLGHHEIVEHLIGCGVDVDSISGDFGSAMHIACSLGHVATVNSLVVAGASCDVTRLFDVAAFRELDVHSDEPWLKFTSLWTMMRFKSTPLTLAAYFGKADVVRLLLKQQVRVDAPCTCWWQDSQSSNATALSFAPFGNNPEVITALLNAGASIEHVDDDGDTPFLTGATLGALNSLKVLADRGACVAAKDSSGNNALTCCVAYNHNSACLAWLIELGLDVNDQSSIDGSTPLIAATSQRRDVSVIQMLLSAGASLDAQDFNGCHPLYYAAVNSEPATLELLLTRGASLSLSTESGFTALMIAADRGLLKNVDLLLSKGANINAATSDGSTALSFAAMAGFHEVVACLCAGGAAVNTIIIVNNETPLALAAKFGHTDVVRVLLSQSGISTDLQDDNGETALFGAARGNHVECLQVLIDAGASPSAANKNGYTALDAATEKGHVDCVNLLARVDTSTDQAVSIASRKGNAACLRILLEANASPNVRDGEGLSALMLASSEGHSECLRLLLNSAAIISQLDSYGNSAIYYACDHQSVDCLRLLLDQGGDPNEHSKRGKTPLMTVATSWAPEAVLCAKLLLERGADADKTDHAGNTALSKAIFGSVDMLKCLIDAGARTDLPDATGRTTLMHTAECSFLQEARTLLDHGADVNFANPVNGMTALAYAISEGEYDMANFLASAGGSLTAAVGSLGVSSLNTARMHARIELDKTLSQPATNVVSDDALSVYSLGSKIDQHETSRKPPSTVFLEELVAALTARIKRLKSDRHPIVALTPFIKATLRRKATAIRNRRAKSLRPTTGVRQVSFLPSSSTP